MIKIRCIDTQFSEDRLVKHETYHVRGVKQGVNGMVFKIDEFDGIGFITQRFVGATKFDQELVDLITMGFGKKLFELKR